MWIQILMLATVVVGSAATVREVLRGPAPRGRAPPPHHTPDPPAGGRRRAPGGAPPAESWRGSGRPPPRRLRTRHAYDTRSPSL